MAAWIIGCRLRVATSLLFYPLPSLNLPPLPGCVCHARLHLDTIRKYWFQPSLTQLAAENTDVTQKAFDRHWRTGCGRAQASAETSRICRQFWYNDRDMIKKINKYSFGKQELLSGKLFILGYIKIKIWIKWCRDASFHFLVLWA